jgi:PEP-CTERM/exosortase A-associated glycosyltransferase
MRILHILDHSAPLETGYALRTREILKEQRAQGWETFQLTGPKQGPAAAKEEHVDGWLYHRTPPPGGLLEGVPALGEIELMGEITYRIEQIVRRIRPHVLHAHSPVLNAIPALRVGRRLDIPVVYEMRASWEDSGVVHGTVRAGSLRYRVSRGLESWALRRADAVTTICDGLRNDIVARGVAPAKVTVVPDAVELGAPGFDDESVAKLRRSLGLEQAWVLGFVGTLRAYEGLDLLLEALPAILAGIPQARVLLAGGGRYEAELKRRAQGLGIDQQVIFTGRIPHGEISSYYGLIDVLVYPRIPTRLTEVVTPYGPLRAMAQNRLVAASDVGGHRELIRHGETGVLFKPGDHTALTQAMLELHRHPERAALLRAAARSFVENHRNWPGTVARYREVYGRLVGKDEI